MKTVLELGQLEKNGLIEITYCNYMDSDEEKPAVTLGYLIEIKVENLNKIPENLKYNRHPYDEKEGKVTFEVFI